MSGQWKYEAVEELQFRPELGRYHSYGLWVSWEAGGDVQRMEQIHDVTVSKRLAQSMAERFSRYQLSPVHFRDGIEDALP